MGTPEFATESLRSLVENGYNIVAVVTAPDKPAGRGMELHQSDVKKYAVSQNLAVLQPEKLRSKLFLQKLKALNADLQVVVAFRMLPEVVWNMPPLGTVNVHASLLPQYRGAAPINWAVINGEKETGITTFKLQHEIDTGNILLQQKLNIATDDNAGHVYEKLKALGAKLLLKTIDGIAEGTIIERPQDQVALPDLRHAPKIWPETGAIDFNKKAEEIINLIRGLSPYPAAYTFLNGKKLKVFSAETGQSILSVSPGHFITDHKTYLNYAASDHYVALKEVQLEGKKKMKVEDFLRGYKF